MSKYIKSIDIDNALAEGEPTIVDKIANEHGILKTKGIGNRSFYSFATKYCSWHNDKAYPIYDSFVHKILVAYKKKDHFSVFNDTDLRNYIRFKEIIFDFKNYYSLEQFNLKEVDKFLWIYSRNDVFAKDYKKTKIK